MRTVDVPPQASIGESSGVIERQLVALSGRLSFPRGGYAIIALSLIFSRALARWLACYMRNVGGHYYVLWHENPGRSNSAVCVCTHVAMRPGFRQFLPINIYYEDPRSN